jgi:hypothetical protein
MSAWVRNLFGRVRFQRFRQNLLLALRPMKGLGGCDEIGRVHAIGQLRDGLGEDRTADRGEFGLAAGKRDVRDEWASAS